MARAFFLLLIATLLLICLDACSGSLSSNSRDKSTLLVLKSQMKGSNAVNGNWSRTTPVCSWIGVSCCSRHKRVARLHLANLTLTGTIPAQLGRLSFLVYLNISYNGFQGSLPNHLSRLHRLRVLDVAHNNFSASVPPGIAKLRKLQYLGLASNTFHGMIPKDIGYLRELKSLHLDNNKISGTIPREIRYLTMLRELSLYNNHLTGAIPREIGDLHELKGLMLGSNKIGGEIPGEIGNLTMLQILSLENNSLTGSIPTSIFNISTLRYLYLGDNGLSGTLPSTMGQTLPNLERLFLNNATLTGRIPQYISNSSKLSIISLELNYFSGPIPSSLGNLRSLICLHLFSNTLTSDSSHDLSFLTSLTNCLNLKHVIVRWNPLNAALPTSIGNFSSSLEILDLSSCKIKGNIPTEIGNLNRLVSLHLSDNNLTGLIPGTLGSLHNLQGLYLGGNKIKGPFPDSLCDLHALSTLNLSQNKFSGILPGCIGTVSSLRKIYLASNAFHLQVPSYFWNLSDLVELDLSNNLFSGNLPQDVGNLKMAISYMDLSGNQFTGNIPGMFGFMTSLSFLSLARNNLEGQIPPSLSGMVNMENLDLSDNNLSGEIPETFGTLRILKYLNVSYNKLRGPIPSQGFFKNADDYHLFASNEALCGAPRLRLPLCPSRRKTTRSFAVIALLIVASFILIIVLVVSWTIRYKCRQVSSTRMGVDLSIKLTFTRFSYQQILDATAGFSRDNFLGSGSFSSVYRATFKSGLLYAVKVFNLQEDGGSKSFERECQVLANLRHRNLTRVISTCSSLDFKALILEYMPNGSLEDWLYSDNRFLSIRQRLDVMIDVAFALEYLHFGYVTQVVHCDLKPSNILLDKDMVGHVTDFGITKLLGEDESYVHTTTLTALGYIAPDPTQV